MESETDPFLFWLGVDAIEDEAAWHAHVRDGLIARAEEPPPVPVFEMPEAIAAE